jgi:hypothetical protein
MLINDGQMFHWLGFEFLRLIYKIYGGAEKLIKKGCGKNFMRK